MNNPLPRQVPTPAVHAWITTELLPRYGTISQLAQHLANRYNNNPNTWRRFLTRLAHQPHLTIWQLDKLCTATYEHITRFQP